MSHPLLFIDNFDSFTFNLVQYFQIAGASVVVRRHNSLSVQEALELQPKAIVLGPGPGRPSNAGISLDLIRGAAGKIPLFGVCLGMQCMVEAFGGRVERADKVMHGKVSSMTHDGRGIFQDIPQDFSATRYHSLLADEGALPSCLKVTARAESGEIMGVRHREWAVEGVQFHPESVLTFEGLSLLRNFLRDL